MIFGNDKCLFKFTKNGNTSVYTPTLCSIVYDYNIPDILLQNAINGNVIQIIKGYYSNFTVTVYDYDENDAEIIFNAQEFLPHLDNTDNTFTINKISEPYYHNDINGFNMMRITIETTNYENLVTV
jgi:hypothetical protein